VRVAVAGLGKMGEAMARRILDAGHDLSVWNRTSGRAGHFVDRGVVEVPELRDVWEIADVCVTSLIDDEALRAVTIGEGGLLDEPLSERTLIDMSTVSLTVSAEVGAAAEATGVGYLRAPVTGNPTVVEAGNLGIIVSGDEEVFRAMEPLLRHIGPNVFYVGGADEARVMKLALNLMVAGIVQLMAEAVVLGEAAGVDRAKMLEVMGQSAVGAPLVNYKAGPLIDGDYSATFTTWAMNKDLALALGVGEDVGVPLPVTAIVQQFLRGCISSGMSELDFITLVPRLRREAGLDPGLEAS
jgi:3-hydroxyisobutyrate dehydrogenase-like beta-hydroxyacid dehydrogenase